MLVWLLSGNVLASISIVALHQTRLIPIWMTVSGQMNQPTRLTQPSALCGMVK